MCFAGLQSPIITIQQVDITTEYYENEELLEKLEFLMASFWSQQVATATCYLVAVVSVTGPTAKGT